MSNKQLIAVGSWKYAHEAHLNVPELEKSLKNVIDFFTHSLGYERALEAITENPTSDDLRNALDRWLATSGRKEQDWIVLYYTGHGKLEANGELYLLTSNYENALTPSTSFAAAQLGTMLVTQNASGEFRPAKRFLLILDTCFSGASGLPLAQALSARFTNGTSGAMFYVVASALPREEALAGGLSEALLGALNDRSLGGKAQEYIYFDQLLPAINARLKAQRALRVALDSPEEVPCFFPNPYYQAGATASADIEEVFQVLKTSEIKLHWDPVSRGVELNSQTGDFFTGRQRILKEVADWLNNPSDHPGCIITGAPGSGKSAILSRILTSSLSAPAKIIKKCKRSELFANTEFDVAIHAKGKSLQETISRVALRLKCPAEPEQIYQRIRQQQQPFRIVLDALDEAKEPARITNEFLRPLLSVPNIKLVVGTRPEWVPKFGPNVKSLHVDNPNYIEKADISRYIKARLKKRSGQINTIASAVAERAYPNFLIARLVAEDLQKRKRLPDPSAFRFPSTVAKAFERYLDRFGTDKNRVRDLLRPLAWAEGAGLPWGSIWAPLATALAERGAQYDNSDIVWLIDNAGAFLVETLDDGRSVYRLYHQALSDHLRGKKADNNVQQLIVKALQSAVPGKGNDQCDWLSADPYHS